MDMAMIGRNIADIRKKAGLTQDELAEKLSVTAQAVSKWENGRNLPDLENLLHIAELTNSPYSALFKNCSEHDEADYVIRDRLFKEENMFTRTKAIALSENLDQTFRALHYMRERHTGQFRRGLKFSSEKVLYINHPLMMACQALAFGIKDDALLAAILLHDVVEDTGVDAEDMPFDDEVRQIVKLVSFSIPDGMTKQQAKDEYFERIKTNPKACLLKIIDRCNNVSTMAGRFSRQKINEHIYETEKYILPLMDELKHHHPQYSDIAFLLKYHILSILETTKCLMIE